ncbi:MAG: DegT/DnrJ/EryC1/StrS aminotransferase family protein, partial [Deltaproteobacteria bacterium]|nr:DegT/DnrJ/EryC1/StrS aminotransferase family protein [Deltaproteobacteria bacterium]
MINSLSLPGISDVRSARFYSLARHALVAGLRALAIGVGHTVGATAVYYPVDVKLQPAIDPVDWPCADAVVAVDYFGFAQPLAPFEKYCAKTGARLIEDNAHGFLSCDESGQWLGSRGEIGLFSLRKTFLMVNGAALAVQALDAAARIAPQLPLVVTAVPSGLRLRRALRYITGSRKPELLAALGVRWIRCRFLGYSIVPPAADAEIQIPGCAEPSSDLFETLAKHEFTIESERRRR